MSVLSDLKSTLGEKDVPIIVRMLLGFLILFGGCILGTIWVALWFDCWWMAVIINAGIIGTYFACKWCEK